MLAMSMVGISDMLIVLRRNICSQVGFPRPLETIKSKPLGLGNKVIANLQVSRPLAEALADLVSYQAI